MSAELYPGTPFSPQATITNSIGEADTIIEVSDVSAFPPAPNLATIGTDEGGETIRYSAKTGTALSGCQRGVEGTAKVWRAGEVIGRNFTAKDHNDLIANILKVKATAEGAAEAAKETAQAAAQDAAQVAAAAATAQDTADAAMGAAATAQNAAADAQKTADTALAFKQDKLTGIPGQVVGFGASGAAAAVQGWSNPNLLDNWYFADPINQRGAAEYDGTYAYGLDRWATNNVRYTVAAHTITVLYAGEDAKLFQPIENSRTPAGVVCTFSAIVDGKMYAVTGNGIDNAVLHAPFGKLILLGTGGNNDIHYVEIRFNYLAAGESVSVYAAKLELGSRQTLAHQDADGKWVLNDPPPNKALELAKCQRYMYVLNRSPYELIGSGMFYSPSDGNFMIQTPSKLRALPYVKTSGMFSINGNGTNAIFNASDVTFQVIYLNDTGIMLQITGIPSNMPVNHATILQVDSINSQIILDSNL